MSKPSKVIENLKILFVMTILCLLTLPFMWVSSLNNSAKNDLVKFIPEHIETDKRLAAVNHIGWHDWSRAAVYRLSPRTVDAINADRSYLGDWSLNDNSCEPPFRGMSNRKNLKIRKFIDPNFTTYSKSRIMFIPEAKIIIVCDAGSD